MRLLAAGLIFLLPLAAQKDFLTPNEVDQVRLTQEPNERLKLYVAFARLRIELLSQQFAREKPGRSALIREKLEEYTKIIEAIDTVAEDALKRKIDITVGLKAVAEAEKEMAARLQQFEESQPADLARYRFVLQQAIETTTDSAEMNARDLETRSAEVSERADKERKEREALLAPEIPADPPAPKPEAASPADKSAEAKPARKPPTLLRKGELPPAKKKQ
jgi:hypothetical protein